MRRRAFRMLDTGAALGYCARLLKFGISFAVECHANGIDIVTPFELQMEEFPETDWLKR